jgi:DNA-binding NtrC family response regulator
MANENILFIDDSPEDLTLFYKFLRREGFGVDITSGGSEGISYIDKKYYDIIFTDLEMPIVDGMGVLKYVKEHSPDSICIVMTGYGTIENAVQAIKSGAFDYLTKPLDIDAIKLVIQRGLEHRNLKRENINLRNQLKKKYKFKNIIGDSKKIQKVFETIEKVADTESTILILGESGTGKELFAKAIHYNSRRQVGPFITVNCAAIPSELLESEVFGHEKGAFTDAIRTRIGRFELANGGTIFLDEIGDMSLSLQSKLLRVLQERQFERIGGVKPIKTDIRIIAATHQDLEKAVEEGKFREDLYYRLNVIPIEIPPLRERKTDILLLVNHFLKQFSNNKNRSIWEINQEVMNRLIQYHWPGNVRELENVIERMVTLSSGDTITLQDLPEMLRNYPVEKPSVTYEIPEGGISLDTAINEFEKKLIIQALNKKGWIKNKAAQFLNLNRTTLVEKMKRKNILRTNS